jgi:hypothetical protein
VFEGSSTADFTKNARFNEVSKRAEGPPVVYLGDPIAIKSKPGHLSIMKQTPIQPELRALTDQLGEDLSGLAPTSGSFCHTVRAEIGAVGGQGSHAWRSFVVRQADGDGDRDLACSDLGGGDGLLQAAE